jgi:dienelactone hydrolase
VPYQLHHGDADTVVPLALDQALAAQLAANPTPHQLLVYPGVTHPQMATDAGMLATVRLWYQQHGLLP